VDVIAEDNLKIGVFEDITIEQKKEDSCTVKVFDTEIVIKKGEVSIKPKKTTIEVDGDMDMIVSGNANVASAKCTINNVLEVN
jgi:hypothetical protein